MQQVFTRYEIIILPKKVFMTWISALLETANEGAQFTYELHVSNYHFNEFMALRH